MRRRHPRYRPAQQGARLYRRRLPTAERYESNLTAIDPLNGEIKKTVHLQYPNYSGAVATGGGLVFVGLLDGTVAAFDDTTLDLLWKVNVGAGFSAPPMTFEAERQAICGHRLGPEPPRGRASSTRRN